MRLQRPYNDQIFVRPLLPPQQTVTGIHIPDDARGQPQTGVVVSVGPGIASELTGTLRPMNCQVGELITFGPYAGMNVEIDGEPLLVMRDQEALSGQPAGTFTLTEHEDGRGRKVAHLAQHRCNLCEPDEAEVKAAANLAEERERIQRERVARGKAREQP